MCKVYFNKILVMCQKVKHNKCNCCVRRKGHVISGRYRFCLNLGNCSPMWVLRERERDKWILCSFITPSKNRPEGFACCIEPRVSFQRYVGLIRRGEVSIHHHLGPNGFMSKQWLENLVWCILMTTWHQKLALQSMKLVFVLAKNNTDEILQLKQYWSRL